MVVVVLPTPPFWLASAMIRAGPCRSVGIGSGIGLRIVYAVGSAGPRSAPRSSGTAAARGAPRSRPRPARRCPPCPLAPSRPDEPSSRCPTVRHSGAARTGRQPFGVSRLRRMRYAVLTSPRVGGRVHLAQPVHGHQRVDLGGGHRGVPEQFLHDPHVGAAVEQVGGVRVAQGVRATACAVAGARRPRRRGAGSSRRSAGTAARRGR